MISFSSERKVMVAARPIDFRKGVNSLVALVAEAQKADPYCGDIFVFRSKRPDRIKLVAWDGTGVILVSKVLENGGFVWPPITDGVIRLNSQELALLLAGMDWKRLVEAPVRRPVKAG
jgi:transposase